MWKANLGFTNENHSQKSYLSIYDFSNVLNETYKHLRWKANLGFTNENHSQKSYLFMTFQLSQNETYKHLMWEANLSLTNKNHSQRSYTNTVKTNRLTPEKTTQN